MFIDHVQLKLKAGKGGNGVVSWRREKYIPKGGPYGGNGGKGGSIIIKADIQLFSLEDYRNKQVYYAENGMSGGTNNQQGRKGKDYILKVPCGTLIKNIITGEVIVDLQENTDTVTLCKGGAGGLGNSHFKTSVRRTPNYCTFGKIGEDLEVELELKLIADVGFIGFPNAGKSTLISALTSVKVPIAPYPFTTLKPNLGYIEFDDYSRILIADIPGIIQGAHQNKGLGLEFLRHVERTKVLIFVLDFSGIDQRDPLEDFSILRDELFKYKESLIDRPFLIALNKIDVPSSEKYIQLFYKKFPNFKPYSFEISAHTKEGLTPFLNKMREVAQKEGKRFI